MIDAIILAGESEKELNGEKNKALISINGRPMIQYVIDALRTSGIVNRIIIIGNHKMFSNVISNEISIINDEGSIMDNVMAGAKYFEESSKILIVTCDIPLLTGNAVRDFIDKSLNSEADICYPIIDKAVSEGKYPEAKRTYAKLKEGTFTGGNLMLVNPEILDRCIPKAKEMIEHRKNPMKMSRVLGFKFLIKLIVGNLTIESVEKRVSKILDIKPKAIITKYPEIGNDVDKPEDIEMVNKYIKTGDQWS